jgi:hypothetical protein
VTPPFDITGRSREGADPARAAALKAFAESNGLEFNQDVDQEFMDPGFFVFGMGTDEVKGFAENVMDGDWDGYPIREFDYSVIGVEEIGVPILITGTDTIEYSVAMIPIEASASLPYVRVLKKDLTKRLEDDLARINHLHVDHGEVESGMRDFDHHFETRSSDPGFVKALLSQDLLETVLEAGTDFAYEVWDNGLVVYASQLKADEVPKLLNTGKSFHDRIPDDARSYQAT